LTPSLKHDALGLSISESWWARLKSHEGGISMKIKMIENSHGMRRGATVEVSEQVGASCVRYGVATCLDVKEAKPKRNKTVKRSKVKTKAVTNGK